ncbi:M10 family metallopeptidase C-terminal domain-containing protein [Caulobacter sp.]|uniref:protease SapA n=1 Tax=Caulobacter sp. TaxID=78 RepID=UPI001617357E
MHTEFFSHDHPDFITITDDGEAHGFVNADARSGVVAGKASLTVPEAALRLLRNEPGWSHAFNVGATVTYAFRATAPSDMPNDVSGFSQFNAAQILQAEKALQAWSDVANIKFVRVAEGGYSNDASILFANYSSGESGAAAFAFYPGNTAISSRSGDVWVNSSLAYNANPTGTNYGGMVLVHELGHAIGLAHPADYDAEAGKTLTYAAHADYYEDSRQYTVMSYFGEGNTGGAFGGVYASAPLLDDIAAAQLAYGANMTTRTGNTVYGFNSNAGRDVFSASAPSSKLVFAVWDAGGVDTLDFSGYRVPQTIDLREGFFSSVGGQTGNVTIAMGATIENAIGGSAADTITGNAVANQIIGGAGNDILDGGRGLDVAGFSGRFAGYVINALATGGWSIKDTVGADGTDTIINIETLAFSDRLAPVVDSRVATVMSSVLRLTPFTTGAEAVTQTLAAGMSAGGDYNAAIAQVLKLADATSGVAALSYQFFTGKTPTTLGMDYLLAPDGPNPTNLNSAYYDGFNTVNRYINFAMNLGKNGEAATAFTANYGALSLFEATRKAYATIFGATPGDQKLHDILDASVSINGLTMTRGQYLAYYAQDTADGQGAKAAMVGWLLAAAQVENVGVYAKSADAFFADQVTHNVYGVDLIGTYARPEYNLVLT